MATIRDVARAAGVSIATVSRVFNNNALVSEDTTRRVLKVAAAVDYWPNGAARSLTTNRSNTFGVLLPDIFGEFYSEVIRGIDHMARRSRYQILLSSSHASGEDIQAATRAMLGRVDGIIMMAPDIASIETVQKLRRRVPVVLLNPSFEVEGCSSVAVDNFSGARAAVNHLLRLGHREIAMVSGPAGNVDAEERMRGFREALAAAGFDAGRMRVIPGDFRETSGYAAGSEIMARLPQPTAVFSANDNMAIGLLSALRNMSVRVPQDLAVVGFDDVTSARYLNPPLTTVNVDAYGLGQQAVGMMLGALGSDGNQPCPRQTLPVVLTVRESCGAQLKRSEHAKSDGPLDREPDGHAKSGATGQTEFDRQRSVRSRSS